MHNPMVSEHVPLAAFPQAMHRQEEQEAIADREFAVCRLPFGFLVARGGGHEPKQEFERMSRERQAKLLGRGPFPEAARRDAAIAQAAFLPPTGLRKIGDNALLQEILNQIDGVTTQAGRRGIMAHDQFDRL
jgi:hypothetical protein